MTPIGIAYRLITFAVLCLYVTTNATFAAVMVGVAAEW